MAIREENVRRALPVMGAGGDAEAGEPGRAEKLGINGQCANGHAVAVVAEVIELDVFGLGDARGEPFQQDPAED